MEMKNSIENRHEIMHEIIKETEDNKMSDKDDNDNDGEAWSNEMNFILDQM